MGGHATPAASLIPPSCLALPLQIVSSLLDVEGMPRKPQYHIASDVPLVLYDCGCAPSIQ